MPIPNNVVPIDPVWGATESNKAPLELLWFDDIHASTASRDFVQGLLVENSAAVIYGASNAGKTFWATDLALHVAAGLEFAGRRVEHGGVVYCVLEGGAGFRNRVVAWKERHGLEGRGLPFAALPYQLNLLDPEADTPRLIEAVQLAARQIEVPLRLIVIDTLSRALAGGNENAPEDMGALVKNMDLIRQETGACVLFIHHSGKDTEKGARGHSLLRAAVDTEIEVVAEEAGPNKTATVVKQRDLKKGEVFDFTLDVVVVGQNPRAENVTSCVVVHSNAGDAYLAMGQGGSVCPVDRPHTGQARHLTRLRGHAKRAFEVLNDTLAEHGQSGQADVPSGCPSVPEKWWRERFMERAMPGSEYPAKQKGFKRAATDLINAHLVGLEKGRVWIVSRAASPRPQEVPEEPPEF